MVSTDCSARRDAVSLKERAKERVSSAVETRPIVKRTPNASGTSFLEKFRSDLKIVS